MPDDDGKTDEEDVAMDEDEIFVVSNGILDDEDIAMDDDDGAIPASTCREKTWATVFVISLTFIPKRKSPWTGY